MGKAVPKAIKMRVIELLEEIPEKFSIDFEANKKVLDALKMPFPKVDRNMMAAFVARKIKAQKKA